MPTPFHAVYFAHELSRSRPANGVERLSQSLVDASIDLNPHQIEAALFALKSPLDTGVILADEVGLGKTIEAGVLLLQSWAERKRRLLVLCPASLRRQWAAELEEKFGLPCRILDARSWAACVEAGEPNPFDTDRYVSVLSYNFAARQADRLFRTAFDLAVIDEAHKLRNAWKPGNVIGQSLKRALAGRRKALLTATPLQNSLMELYGLASFIDDYIFGDAATYRANFTGAAANLDVLRGRLRSFCHRTLREDVQEYVRYTERRPLTVPFTPTDAEQALYDRVSAFLLREGGFAIPKRQRRLTLLVLRKLLASSSRAIAGTLDTIIQRLEGLQRGESPPGDGLLRDLMSAEEFTDEDQDEADEEDGEAGKAAPPAGPLSPDLDGELDELRRCRALAEGLRTDTKAQALLKALDLGFAETARTGAARKALVFTESRRTQDYLRAFLEANGHAGQVVAFNGSNADADARAILDRWLAANRDTGRATGSRPVDMRTALVDHFRDGAAIMLATEAAAEGINLQFCSLVVNYDLPWNPQRIEQRIGRCHRYGQKHDVVVVNFINRRNAADRRVYELLDEKFRLFEGVFGASDEVLGALESGVDFERSILAIYQDCRTEAEIDAAFARLQAELEETIRSRMAEARRTLFAHFDEDVHARLRMRMDDARLHLDRASRMFWRLTRYMLEEVDKEMGKAARFDDAALAFDLDRPPLPGVAAGRYRLAVRQRQGDGDGHTYRLSHPLAEHLIERAKALETPQSEVLFDLSAHPARISVLEPYVGGWGWLTLTLVTVESFAREEVLVLTAIDRRQQPLPREAAEKLFLVPAQWRGLAADPHPLIRDVLEEHSSADAALAVEVARARNARYLEERRQRLDQWADDAIKGAERELDEVKARLKELSRQARQTEDPAEQHRIQTEIQAAERDKRRARQRIFEAEDEVMAERDRLIADLGRRVGQSVETRRLFTLKWVVR